MPFWRSLAAHKAWTKVTHGAVALTQRAVSSECNGSLRAFSLDEMLVMGRPQMAEGYHSPLAWFTRSMIHPHEIVTTEAVQALASYLARRHRLHGKGSLLEVAAGNARLAYHLNKTGFLSAPLIATDVQPVPSPSVPGGAFPCEAMDHSTAIASHGPVAVLLCAWMPHGEDWTPAWRSARVAEYVLLGDVCSSPEASYNREHPGYERVVLEDVSRHMLHYSDAVPELAAKRGSGVACAVSYRRRAKAGKK